MKRSTLAYLQQAVASALSVGPSVRLLPLLLLGLSSSRSVGVADTFTESWNLMRQDEQTQGTPGSYLHEVRRRQDGLPVSDRFLREEGQQRAAGGRVPAAAVDNLFGSGAGNWLAASAETAAAAAATGTGILDSILSLLPAGLAALSDPKLKTGVRPGYFLGAGAQSDADQPADAAATPADLKTSEHLGARVAQVARELAAGRRALDRKSTRLNSSH